MLMNYCIYVKAGNADRDTNSRRALASRAGARTVTNNPVIGIEARRSRITKRLIECETFLATTTTL